MFSFAGLKSILCVCVCVCEHLTKSNSNKSCSCETSPNHYPPPLPSPISMLFWLWQRDALSITPQLKTSNTKVALMFARATLNFMGMIQFLHLPKSTCVRVMGISSPDSELRLCTNICVPVIVLWPRGVISEDTTTMWQLDMVTLRLQSTMTGVTPHLSCLQLPVQCNPHLSTSVNFCLFSKPKSYLLDFVSLQNFVSLPTCSSTMSH